MIILLIDSDFAVLKEMRRMTIAHGDTAILATDTETALARIAKHDPQLIVVNFTGVRALRAIRVASPDATVLPMHASATRKYTATRCDASNGFLWKGDLHVFPAILDRCFGSEEVQNG